LKKKTLTALTFLYKGPKELQSIPNEMITSDVIIRDHEDQERGCGNLHHGRFLKRLDKHPSATV